MMYDSTDDDLAPSASELSGASGVDNEAAFEASLSSDSISAEPTSLLSHLPAAPGGLIAQPSWIGKRLGRFKLLRLLGEGSMGRVIQAMDVNLRRIVALKVLRKQIRGMDQQLAVEQFLREARAAAAIEHPNIVRIYEINDYSGWWYIAMEMVEGGTLRDVVRAAGPLSYARACPLIADAATALTVAHERGVIHRDIKPNNLMLTRDGRCKISDFGLVRYEDPNDPFDFTDKSVGTPKYMAPEIVRQEPPTSAIDVYSLGCALYYALAGSAPYTGNSISEITRQHLHSPPPDLRGKRADAPETLVRLIRQMMAKSPTDRPSAAAAAAVLHAEALEYRTDASGSYAGASASTLGRPTRADDREGAQQTRLGNSQRRRAVLIGAGLIAVAIAAGASVLLSHRVGGPIHFSSAFPNAPKSYGSRPVDSMPIAEPPPTVPPPFSWVGQVDPHGNPFVASRDGEHYWPIHAPAAQLIRADRVVFYPTEAAAKADGKVPAGS